MNEGAQGRTVPADELIRRVGETFVSAWFVVDQARIDAFAKVIFAYNVTPDRRLAERRIFARFEEGWGWPDGMAVDAEGAVWVADAAHSRLIRVAEGGRILEERKTQGVGVFACMLGGDDGRTLFASVAPTFDEAEASANHQASILMMKVEVPHAGLP